MSLSANVSVDVTLGTRAEMNVGTPRQGNWTYHHIQPVRIYYLAASMMLRVITDPNAIPFTRTLVRDALERMCNNDNNRNTLGLFIDNHIGQVVSTALRQPVARLCASPPFGGFAGLNPTQRSDDPHDQAEFIKPVSAIPQWWASLIRLGDIVLAAFGLHAIPLGVPALVSIKTMGQWNEIVIDMYGEIMSADLSGSHGFSPADWRNTAGGNWAIVNPAHAANWNPHRRLWAGQYPQMQLRLPHEVSGVVPAVPVPVAATLPLRRREDFLDYLV